MGTSQFGRGHKPCRGMEFHSTEWQYGSLPEDTEDREHKSSAKVQKRQERGAHAEGAPERVDVWGGPKATPTPRS
jgi:hypothetical protein